MHAPVEVRSRPRGMARPERFELPTPRSVVWCSIQLSYGRNSGRNVGVREGCGTLLDERRPAQALSHAAASPPMACCVQPATPLNLEVSGPF